MNKIILISGITLLFVAVISIFQGSAHYSIQQILQALQDGPSSPVGYVLWYVRIPRTFACLLSGSALAASGLIIQKVLGNKLASPGIIGVNAGAGLTITICFSLGVSSGLLLSGAAFTGAMLASVCIIAIARVTGMHKSDLILSGLGLNGLLNAAAEVIRSVNAGAASMSADFKVGGFSSVSSSSLFPVSIVVIVMLILAELFVNDLDVLSMGEDTAKSLGMNTALMRTVFLLIASALAGAAVCIAGMLSFVGLLVPHITRHIAGNESGSVLPLSIISGGIFVTLCDILSRLIFAPYEVPAGILISAVGSFFLVFILLKPKIRRAS